MTPDDTLTDAWEASYGRSENHLFWPSDEVVRFVSRYIRRRVGIHTFRDIVPKAQGARVLDIGCGIGRHVVFGMEMGFDMYGADLSHHAVEVAQNWLETLGKTDAKTRVLQADIRHLPWDKGSFAHAICDSALDSMPFEIAQEGVKEIARLVVPKGYFYCSLISGDETGRTPDFCGEEVVMGTHEKNTIQSYFNANKIEQLLEPLFEILECTLVQAHKQSTHIHHGRWHVVARRR